MSADQIRGAGAVFRKRSCASKVLSSIRCVDRQRPGNRMKKVPPGEAARFVSAN
jgi:hypothetical protein